MLFSISTRAWLLVRIVIFLLVYASIVFFREGHVIARLLTTVDATICSMTRLATSLSPPVQLTCYTKFSLVHLHLPLLCYCARIIAGQPLPCHSNPMRTYVLELPPRVGLCVMRQLPIPNAKLAFCRNVLDSGKSMP